ncbi:phosphoadenosine phosphosulfate reductase family protein (plasmid) [Brevundimonas staleyi]|uniref:Phosphoadenosine phosphosulfate reductase family protein n=1 Tax=Brevundimonas staleyi TaxID=74326 RepID=A0ABW0FPQ1_9CAUL
MTGPDLAAYDRILIAFSGGKDSLACLLHLLALGVDPARIELHHHDVDGDAPFMDWPCTLGYCRAVAAQFGLPLYRSWREGGFLGEMDRDGTPTGAVLFERPDGRLGRSGGEGPPGVRGRFPQVSADLRVRWCSGVLKIDVMAALIRGQDRFLDGRTLVVTGERAEESPGRARYAVFEAHRTATAGGRRPPRRVDHWRPIHAWDEGRVWAVIARSGLVPHPAYRLGWGRLSCRCCIFGSPHQWATVRALFPAVFARIAAREAASGFTLHRAASVIDLADRGRPYAAALAQPELAAQAEAADWTGPIVRRPWTLPAGAFGEAAGPV